MKSVNIEGEALPIEGNPSSIEFDFAVVVHQLWLFCLPSSSLRGRAML